MGSEDWTILCVGTTLRECEDDGAFDMRYAVKGKVSCGE